MKKILALLLALMMALTASGALAEDVAPTTLYGYITLNEEMLPGLLSMTGTEMDEASQEVMDMLVDILNNTGFYAVIGESSLQASLTLKDQAVLNVVGALDEKGVTIVSDLFPSYAITVAQETLDELLNTASASLPAMDEEAAMAAIAPHTEKLIESFQGYIGEAVPGEYTIEEGLTFTHMIPVKANAAEVVSLLLNFYKDFANDPAFAPVLEGTDIASFTADVDALLADLASDPENAPDINMALYANLDAAGNMGDDFYMTIDMSDDETTVAMTLGMVDEQVSASMLVGDAIYASMDEMISAAVYGGGNATLIELVAAPLENENDFFVGLDVYAQGMYMGLYTESVTEEEIVSSYTELYFLDAEAPLLALELYQMPEGEDVSLTLPEGTPVITLEDLINDTEGTASTPLLMDIMSYGVNNLLANAGAAMPDEVSALLTLMYAPMPIEETTTVEGVTEVGQ